MDITPGNIIRYAGEFCLVLSIDYTEKTCLVINKEGVVFTRDMSVIRNNYKSALLENLLTALKNFESEQENIVRDNESHDWKDLIEITGVRTHNGYSRRYCAPLSVLKPNSKLLRKMIEQIQEYL